MDEAEASLIREELSLRWKRIQFLEAENAKLKERGVKHHAEAAKFLATQAALKEQVKILKAENAKLKEELEQHRWIPVEEGVPETDGVYLTMYKGDGRQNLRKEVWIRAYPFSDTFRDAWIYKEPTKYSVLYWKPIVLPKE